MRIARQVTPALALLLLSPAPRPRHATGEGGDQDPPSRVGRLSFLSGPVSLRPASVDDWGAATINYPLTTGDHLWTDADARAEISIGTSAIRLGPQSAFAFLALDDRTTQIRLSQGAVQVRLRRLDDDEVVELDTPNGAVSLLRPGSYRVDVDSTGDTTTVTVRRGQAEVTAGGSAFTVRSGEAALVSGGDAPSYDVYDALPPDDWEDWCAARDRRWDDARSAHYVSRDVIGYEDLDEYGEWRETDPYGPVWVPRTVVTGWAPYRYGHWAWVDPWGWTWIDDAPWGFAPFHYGRWVYVDGGWAWVPGRVVRVRPVYAPALVVFVGGGNWSLAIGVGGGSGVAWFPLGPDEPYVPAYRVSDTYVRNVNVTNVNVTNINVTNITYRNRTVPGAVTGVPRDAFVGARPVGPSAVIVPRERLATARVVGMAPAVAPVRQSVLAAPANGLARRPPARAALRPVVVRTTPPPPAVPFNAREQALQAHPGRPLDDATLAALRARSPAPRQNQLIRPAAPPAAAARPARPGAPPAAPSPKLKPVREGLPAARPLPPAAATPRPEIKPPARGVERPPPAERPQGRERPAPAPALAPAARPTPPAERPQRAQPQPSESAARPHPKPERPATPPAARRQPEKARKAETDTLKQKERP